VRVTIRKAYDFGGDRDAVGRDLIRPEGWDAARESSTAFGLPGSRPEWEQLADAPELGRRAAAVVAVARRLGARSLCSHGVGTGTLELAVHRAAPELVLTCTDYAPRATERLRLLFPEARVLVHDLAAEPPPTADFHLMYRIDTELDDDAWGRVIARFSEPVLFVPALLLDVPRLVKELARRVVRPSASRAGWLRTEDALHALWRDTHDAEPVRVDDLRGFLLTRRKGAPPTDRLGSPP
jgi:hypothetical protein